MIALSAVRRVFRVGEDTVYGLRSVSLRVRKGEYLSIMGPSGSGKSTLLNIMGLLDRPDAGTYTLASVDTTALSDSEQAAVRQHKIGFIFQFFHLIPRLTAAENVELPMVLAGIDPARRKARVTDALAQLGLADRARHRPEQLSGGQRQRVAIARATIMDPAVILADEPTGNLDRASGADVIRTIEALNARGMAVVMVTHDPELGRRAGRQVLMADGDIVSDTGGDG